MKKAHTNTKHTDITYRQLFEYIKFHKLSIDDPITIYDTSIATHEIHVIDKLAISNTKELLDDVEENTCLLILKF